MQSGTGAGGERGQESADAARGRGRRRGRGGDPRQERRDAAQALREGTRVGAEEAEAERGEGVSVGGGGERGGGGVRQGAGAHEGAPGFAAGSNLGALEQESETAESAVRSAQERVDVLNGQLAGLDFKFADPRGEV